MKSAVIVFPGSNCDRDVAVALERISGQAPAMVWHRETSLPNVDLIVLPGGFSYGDYLRSGAIAAQSPVIRTVQERAAAGVRVMGICNGFQVLTETGLLPGALMRNAQLTFLSRTVSLRVETAASDFTGGYTAGQTLRIPVAHHDGNYQADADTLTRLRDEDRIAFRYLGDGADPDGAAVNGSVDAIAGILNERRNVLGLMPHPERAVEPIHGGTDGRGLFDSLVAALS